MDIKKHIKDGLLMLKVVPNSSRTRLVEENASLKMYINAVPDKDKANIELIKYFKKLSLKVVIKSGRRSRIKVLKVL